jgi:ABC-type transport system involved in Fe-S cluster assembly fused permease/ATPase subunit
VHPVILKFLIDALFASQPEYWLVVLYVVARFLADIAKSLSEVPFSNISANAEVHIANKVYNHIQNQSLAFHLKREGISSLSKILYLASNSSNSKIPKYFLKFSKEKMLSVVEINTCQPHRKQGTGKIIRICSRGSQSFAQILRY